MQVRLVLVLAACCVSIRAAAANPSQDFNLARDTFRSGQFKDAALRFNSLLYPTNKIEDVQETIDAHVMLAVSNFEIGMLDAAEREFLEAINLDPSLEITTYGVSSEAERFFEKQKKQFEDKAREAEDRVRRAQLEAAVDSIQVTERTNYWLNLVPFGVGQFQNGERGKGIFFASSQAAFGAMSFGIWSYLRSRYPNGEVPVDEVDSARNLQVLQITAGTIAIGVMVWGVVDAFLHYEVKPRPLTADEKQQYLRELERAQKRKPSAQLTPLLTPDGAGAALTWEF